MPGTHLGGNDPSHAFLISEKAKDFLRRQFVEFVQRACNALGIRESDVAFCEAELARAFNEANRDLQVMRVRRGGAGATDFKGQSIGKIGGMLAFRLSRFRIIHMQGDGVDHPESHKLQDLAVLWFVVQGLLGVDVSNAEFREAVALPMGKLHKVEWIFKEILYLLHRRHINQEILAVLFDLLARFAPPLPRRTIRL